MSQFKEKKFLFTGKFTFFSDQQRDDAIAFHGALLSKSLSDGADFIVIGDEFDQEILQQQTEESVYSEWDFCKYVIRPTQTEDECNSQSSSNDEIEIATEVDIEELASTINQTDSGKIYTCLFIYPYNKSENPIIRCLFSYIKEGKSIYFACRGLTDDSSGLPLTQFGMLSISKSVKAISFESLEDSVIEDNVYVTQSNGLDDIGFPEAMQADKPLKLSQKAMTALRKLDAFQDNIYFIEDTDIGYYRLEPKFHEQHSKEIEVNESFLDDEFSEEIYYAAESVLSTGRGWLF